MNERLCDKDEAYVDGTSSFGNYSREKFDDEIILMF